jgi:mRNA interferase MazF
MRRGEIWWAEPPAPVGAKPGFRRPLLIIQADDFNRSSLRTVIGVALTTNLRLADAPGNLLLPAAESGLPKDSVVNVTQILTVDKGLLTTRAGAVDDRTMLLVEDCLRLVTGLV